MEITGYFPIYASHSFVSLKISNPSSRRDQQLERLRKKYPDKKFEDDEEIYGQISDDYDQYEHDLDGYKGREKAMSDMFAADPRSAQFLADMHNGQDPYLGLVKNFGMEIKDVLDEPEMQDKIAEANKEYVERVAKSKQLDEEYEKNMDETLESAGTKIIHEQSFCNDSNR